MFDFIKKLFGSIGAFFTGLLGGKKAQGDAAAPKAKKSKGYFLELDETGSVKSETETKKPEPVKAQAEAPEKSAEPAKAAVATIEPPKAESAKPSENGRVKAQAQPVAPVTAPAAPAAPAAAKNGKVEPESTQTFAPNYLLPKTSNSRRRPGPSMDMFRDMARQVKPSS
jgi:hypothetical protein